MPYKNLQECYEALSQLNNSKESSAFFSDLDDFSRDVYTYLHIDDYLTREELDIIKGANTVRGSKVTEHIDLVGRALAIRESRRVYREQIQQLNEQNPDKSVFNLLKKAANNDTGFMIKISGVEKRWREIHEFASLSPYLLTELAKKLEQIENYFNQLISDSTEMPANFRSSLQSIVNDAKELIAAEKKKVASAMLARMSLIKKDDLAKLNDDKDFTVDEVHVAISVLDELKDLGLRKSFVDIIKQKVPKPKQFTQQIIFDFNKYTSLFGTPAQKDQFASMYPKQNGKVNIPLSESQTYVRMDGSNNLGTSFIAVNTNQHPLKPIHPVVQVSVKRTEDVDIFYDMDTGESINFKVEELAEYKVNAIIDEFQLLRDHVIDTFIRYAQFTPEIATRFRELIDIIINKNPNRLISSNALCMEAKKELDSYIQKKEILEQSRIDTPVAVTSEKQQESDNIATSIPAPIIPAPIITTPIIPVPAPVNTAQVIHVTTNQEQTNSNSNLHNKDQAQSFIHKYPKTAWALIGAGSFLLATVGLGAIGAAVFFSGGAAAIPIAIGVTTAIKVVGALGLGFLTLGVPAVGGAVLGGIFGNSQASEPPLQAPRNQRVPAPISSLSTNRTHSVLGITQRTNPIPSRQTNVATLDSAEEPSRLGTQPTLSSTRSPGFKSQSN